MSPRRSSQGTGGLVVSLVVGLLAVTAVLLAVFALRTPATPDAGELPGPIPTWGSSSRSTQSTPTDSYTSTAPVAITNPQFLSMYDASLGARATRGSCTGTPPVVQRTSDGGASWNTVTFDGVEVRQVLGLDFASDSEIVVVAATADCVPTVIISYTGGEFWEAYPDQVGAAVFVQPTDPRKIRSPAGELIAPCTVAELHAAGAALVALCVDGELQVYSSATGSWERIGTEQALSFAPSGTTSILVAESSSGCAGVLIRSVDLATGNSNDLACLVVDPTDGTIDAGNGAAYYWSATDFLGSSNGGAQWSPVR